MSQRFTIDGGEALESFLQSICTDVKDGVLGIVPEKQLQGLVLGGGYGRGEGGVLRIQDEELPYNDLEFFLFLRGSCRINETRYSRPIHILVDRISKEAGIDLEIKILSRRKFEQSSVSMAYYDLAAGHRRILGPDDLLSHATRQSPNRIPLCEATRLLMNRCSGLLFAEARLRRGEFSPQDADFVYRNQSKVKLAFGDVLLTALGRYHWSCRERARRMADLADDYASGQRREDAELGAGLCPWVCEVSSLHVQGVDFKLHPTRSQATAEALACDQTKLVQLARQLWLWIETRRLGCEFRSGLEYATSSVRKCPEKSLSQCCLANLRFFGVGTKRPFRYPRERLLNALPLLLWGDVEHLDLFSKPGLLDFLSAELDTAARDFQGLVRAYKILWEQFN